MTDDPMLTRRGALKLGAGAGAAAIGLSGAGLPESIDPVDDAEAGLLLTGAIGFGGAMAARWALRELDMWPADDPPDGLGPDALHTSAYKTLRTRKSTNASTIIDNQNIIGYMEEPVFSEGKLAALDAIKNGSTKAEATTAGKDEAGKHMATVEKNLLKTWNESLNELENLQSAIKSADNIEVMDVFQVYETGYYDPDYVTQTTTLRNGESFDYREIGLEGSWLYSPLGGSGNAVEVKAYDGSVSKFDLLIKSDWSGIWSDLQTKFDNIENNISVWVDNTYDKIQTGEISPGEYLSATDLANTIAADDSRALAIADLIAMNIPGDYGTEVTIKLLDDETKLTGYLASTDPGSNSTLTEGVTVDPSSTSGSWYVAYLPSTVIETIPSTQYNESYGIQGGEFRLWSDPLNRSDGTQYENVSYVVDTSKNESAYVDPTEFNQTTNASGGTIWQTDIDDRLDNTIADISRIRRINDGAPDKYRTLDISQPFEVLSIEGDDGVTIEQQRTPQEDDNYITESEWQEFLDQQEKLIERYDDAAASGGGIDIGLGGIDVPSVGPIDTVGEWIVVGAGTILGSIALGNLSN